jgi:hypothetical protein
MRSFIEPASNCLFVNKVSAESIQLLQAPPAPSSLKTKGLLLIKARNELTDDDIVNEVKFPTGIENEVIFMEINRPVLENLYASCQVSPLSNRHFRAP